MRIFFSVIRWIFGSMICLASIGGFMNGEIGKALIALIIGLLLLPPISKFLFTRKKTEKPLNQKPSTLELFNITSKSAGNNTTEISLDINKEYLIEFLTQKQKDRETEIKNFNYSPMQIQRQGLQILESLSILNSTKNLDTLVGRYEFITKMYDDFIKASYNKRYTSDIQTSIDQYKSMYYDRILNDFELGLLVQPNEENLKDYYSQCLFSSFNKFYNEQLDQIETLKKEDAKERRTKKIIEIGNLTIEEFDKNGSTNEKFRNQINDIRNIIEKLNKVDERNINYRQENSINPNNPIIINPYSPFQITLYNSDKKTIMEVEKVLKDENIWNKTKELLPLFTKNDIRCKEVDEYILKYKPLYQNMLRDKLSNSTEYQQATERDKEIIEDEIKDEILNQIPERADCDLQTLFDFSDIDITIDNVLIQKYGFDVISKYFGLNHYKNKIVGHWERKDFEDLLNADLAIAAENIPKEEILASQTLKVLNSICEKEDGFFKRKNKAIDYLNENQNLISNIGKFVATRNLFKLKKLPSEFDTLDVEKISANWNFTKEYIKLISETFRNSEYSRETNNRENYSWIKGFTVEKFEDYNSNFVCQRAREECKKKYSKSNPPKLPFHIGCNCTLRTEI